MRIRSRESILDVLRVDVSPVKDIVRIERRLIGRTIEASSWHGEPRVTWELEAMEMKLCRECLCYTEGDCEGNMTSGGCESWN